MELGEKESETGGALVYGTRNDEFVGPRWKVTQGRTFLNSYRSVELLNSHMPFTLGSSNGSLGRQYSIMPD